MAYRLNTIINKFGMGSWQYKIYYNQFVLLESNSGYILVQFVATQETYDINISKFNKFLSGLKINIIKKTESN